LLALRALEQEFTGKIKVIYIDPPFNTGAAFDHYDDGIEHSTWLNLMYSRLKILYSLLREDGSIFVHIDDNEMDYLKIVLDELFGRKNFINRITIDARSPSAFSTVNPGVFKASEYILWYAKNKAMFSENPIRIPRNPDYAYNKYIENIEEPFANWRTVSALEAYQRGREARARHPRSIMEHFNRWMIDNADRLYRLASISDTGAGKEIIEIKRKSALSPGKIFKIERDGGLDDVYVLNGQQMIFYAKNVADIDGQRTSSAILTNIWSDISWEGISGEGGVQFKKGKKPERLIRRCLDLASDVGDWVLDSFAGSGTTGAVAHKMGRRWIMVELGEHCHTHIIPRLRRVIDGTDKTGITEAVGWKGGGGFRYYRLAPSLIERDQWGQPVISPAYNAAMLAEAMCKLMGFRYEPSPDVFWQQGRSSERDFIYTTTRTLAHEELAAISAQVGDDRTLLICCKAFRMAQPDAFPNLTVKKIPNAVLAKCEWGKDDYSLNVANLPMAAPVEEPAAPARKKRRGTAPDLFDQATAEEEPGA
jgi:adenine-specific DNA-methyltransferase